MPNEQTSRDDILTAAKAFEAKTVDYAKDSIVFQLTGESSRIDDFITLMRDYNILEICRTGIVSLEKGSETIRKVTNL
jgi:acetolactate synthase-1/3 small subunit